MQYSTTCLVNNFVSDTQVSIM